MLIHVPVQMLMIMESFLLSLRRPTSVNILLIHIIPFKFQTRLPKPALFFWQLHWRYASFGPSKLVLFLLLV
jgi:hypothetical protein